MSGKTIVLIHGAWNNYACWDSFRGFYEERGYQVVVPSWPYNDRTPEELRASPDPRLARIGIAEIIDHFQGIVEKMAEPPILIGHSFGGLTVQVLLDRGFGAAGVAIDSAPPRGVGGITWPAIRSVLPVITAPFGFRRILRMSLKHFIYGWASDLSAERQRHDWETYIVPTPGRPFFQNVNPLSSLGKVDFANKNRAPLLLTAGGDDRSIPPSMTRNNYQKYRDQTTAVTAFKEFPGRNHWVIKQPGWEEVAGYAIDWVEEQLQTSVH